MIDLPQSTGADPPQSTGADPPQSTGPAPDPPLAIHSDAAHTRHGWGLGVVVYAENGPILLTGARLAIPSLDVLDAERLALDLAREIGRDMGEALYYTDRRDIALADDVTWIPRENNTGADAVARFSSAIMAPWLRVDSAGAYLAWVRRVVPGDRAHALYDLRALEIAQGWRKGAKRRA